MRDLRLSRKLSIAAIVLMLAALYAIGVVYELTTAGIEFARRERLGLELHAQLRAMQLELQTYRGSSNAVIAGMAERRASMDQARAGVEAVIARVEDFHRRAGDALGSLAAWKRVRAAWEPVRTLAADESGSANLAAHNALLDAVLGLMDRVATGSNLILDPALETYLLIDALVVREPRASMEFGQTRSLGLLLMGGKAGAEEQERLIELLASHSERAQRMRNSLATAIQAAPQLAARLEPDVAGEKAASDAFFAAGERVRRDPASPGISPAQFFEIGAAANAARYELYQSGTRATDELLVQRIDGLSARRSVTLAGVSLALVVSAALLLLILHDVTRRLRLAARSAEQLAAGRLHEDVQVEGRDEVGVLMQSMAKARARLQEFSAAEFEIARQQALGNMHYRIDVGKFPGAYGEIAETLNRLVDAHVLEQTRIIDTVQSYVRGDVSVDPPVLPGEKLEITHALEEVRRFQASFHDSPMPMVMVETATRRYIHVNAAWIAQTGYPRAEVIGRTSFEFGLLDQVRFEALAGANSATGGNLDGRELTIRRRDGAVRICLVWSHVVTLKGASLTVAWSIDITERKRAEEALLASEARFSAMFHAAPQALSVVGLADRRFRDVNQAWIDLHGYSRDRVIGHRLEDFALGHETEKREQAYVVLEREQRADRQPIRFTNADGSERMCLMSGRVMDFGNERVAIWALSDVTGQHRAQRQIEEHALILERLVSERTSELTRANEELKRTLGTLHAAQEELVRAEKHAALGRMVAGVAHELNTPIGNSLLVATTLREEVKAFATKAAEGLTRGALAAHMAHLREGADMLERNLDRAADLIASFKQVAADQSGAHRRRFPLDEMVDDVVLTQQPALRRGRVTASARIPAAIEMESFPGPLGQVLANLMANAVLHAYEGREGGSLTISAARRGDDAVEIAVRDEGNGISGDALKHVFDPFYTTKLGRGGTGLGLAICQTLVTDVLGGTIRIDSTPGVGTTVTLELPLVAPQAVVARNLAGIA